jgi:hypothetical protein
VKVVGQSGRTIKPGESEEVSVKISSVNLIGKYSKRISVTTNDPKRKKVTLRASGRVLVPFKSSPRFVNFKKIDPDTTPQPIVVTLRRGDGGPLDPKIEGFGKPGIDAILEEIREGEEYRLIIGVSPPIKPGRLRSWIRLSTGVEEVPMKTVPVYAEIPSSWAA